MLVALLVCPPPSPPHRLITEGAGWFYYASVSLCLSHIRRTMVWAVFQTAVLCGQTLIPQSCCSSIRYPIYLQCVFWPFFTGSRLDTQVASQVVLPMSIILVIIDRISMYIGRSGIPTDISPPSVDIDQPPPFYGWNIADTASNTISNQSVNRSTKDFAFDARNAGRCTSGHQMML